MVFETLTSFVPMRSTGIYLEPNELLHIARLAAREARRRPVGSDRNELRQIVLGLKWMAKRPCPRRSGRPVIPGLTDRASSRGL